MMIVAASGMLTGGRIVHHLREFIDDPTAMLLFVGYQGQGTLGAHLQAGAKRCASTAQPRTVRCQVRSISGFSAHADESELIDWLGHLARRRGKPRRVFLVHGDPDAEAALVPKVKALGLERLPADVARGSRARLRTRADGGPSARAVGAGWRRQNPGEMSMGVTVAPPGLEPGHSTLPRRRRGRGPGAAAGNAEQPPCHGFPDDNRTRGGTELTVIRRAQIASSAIFAVRLRRGRGRPFRRAMPFVPLRPTPLAGRRRFARLGRFAGPGRSGGPGVSLAPGVSLGSGSASAASMTSRSVKWGPTTP